MSPEPTAPQSSSHFLDRAAEVERWLRQAYIPTARGAAWTTDPLQPDAVRQDLYAGFSGIVIFLVELHHATGEMVYLHRAVAGALDLASRLPSRLNGNHDFGLYSGLAGVAFTLEEVGRASGGDARLARAVRRAHGLMKQAARKAAGRLPWSTSTDILGGSAGTGLYLLYAARHHDDPALIELAVETGRALVAAGQRTGDTLKWSHSAARGTFNNFAHGVAGVGFFLTRLHAATGERVFLDAALGAARYLDSVAYCVKDGWIAPVDDDLASARFHAGWCHGPPGAARFFFQLARAVPDPVWSERVHACARATIYVSRAQYGPARWNKVNQCCGAAGTGQFFLALHRADPRPGYLDIAYLAAQFALERATREAGGIKWILARDRTGRGVTQTGYMLGAAGVGTFFLDLAALQSGRRLAISFPDNPFQD